MQDNDEDAEMAKARADYVKRQYDRQCQARNRYALAAVVLLLVFVGTMTTTFWCDGLTYEVGFSRSSAIYKGWVEVGEFICAMGAFVSGICCLGAVIGACALTYDLRRDAP